MHDLENDPMKQRQTTWTTCGAEGQCGNEVSEGGVYFTSRSECGGVMTIMGRNLGVGVVRNGKT